MKHKSEILKLCYTITVIFSIVYAFTLAMFHPYITDTNLPQIINLTVAYFTSIATVAGLAIGRKLTRETASNITGHYYQEGNKNDENKTDETR